MLLSAIQSEFLSTLPVRGATPVLRPTPVQVDISIHAPREGSDATARNFGKCSSISIHAPREGSDYDAARRVLYIFDISIHAPREGSDFGWIRVAQESK